MTLLRLLAAVLAALPVSVSPSHASRTVSETYRVPASGIGPGALRAAERGRVDHERWSGLWGAAHALLAAAHPERAAETRATVRALVPLERPGLTAGPPISATRRAAPRPRWHGFGPLPAGTSRTSVTTNARRWVTRW